MAVKDKRRGGLSCFLIIFRCYVVIHFVNSLFVFKPRGDHKLKNVLLVYFCFLLVCLWE